MSPGIISGSGGLTVTSGSLQLDNTATTQAGNSSFTGNVNITGGTLAINNIAAFNSGNGTTSPLGNMTLASRTITIGAGGVLNLLDGNTTGANTATIQASMILNGGEVIETNPYNANNSTLGPLFLNGGTLATLGGNNSNWQPFMFGENPLGSGGTVSVSGSANSYIMLSSGGTAVVNGIVADGFQLAPSNTFSVAGPGALYVSLPLLNQNNGNSPYGGNAASLIKTGTGLLVLSASNSYTGATTISAGTLELGIGGSLASPVAVNVASGGLVFASGLGTATLGGLSGSGNIALTDLTGGNVLLNLNGASTTNTTYSGVYERRRRLDERGRHAVADQFEQRLYRPDHGHRRSPRPGQHGRFALPLAEPGRQYLRHRGRVRRSGRRQRRRVQPGQRHQHLEQCEFSCRIEPRRPGRIAGDVHPLEFDQRRPGPPEARQRHPGDAAPPTVLRVAPRFRPAGSSCPTPTP